LKLIQTHAILHQAQRERDDRGRVVATVADYAAVYELIADLIGTAVEASVPKTIRETVDAVRELTTPGRQSAVPRELLGVSFGEIARHLKLDKSTVSRRVAAATKTGYLDDRETRKGRPAQIVLSDPLPEERSILPRPDMLVPNGGVV